MTGTIVQTAVLGAAADNWIGLGLAALLAVFLVVALLQPERF